MRQPASNICPLLAIAGAASGPAVCIEERCAWWSLLENGCAILEIGDNLNVIAADQEGRADGG